MKFAIIILILVSNANFIFSKSEELWKNSIEELLAKNSSAVLEGSKCYRKCVPNDYRICYFHWVLEHYHTMGP